ncbi:MAG: hypothetical protein A2804_00360 [Candidatus Pacebacteria bacterium RIFCSPHIGHO2_01_FULL_46_10]|nr:MAG: hypothetical protein A2804_00360 [Candidatus Pacebacteria bacterium RIFCSPHIGHO2_01_FULL_46_10]
MNYLFFLGRVRDISLAELDVVLRRFHATQPPEEVIPGIVRADVEASADELMSILGGTIKIAEVLEISASTITADLQERVVEVLAGFGTQGEKLVFSLAELGRGSSDHIGADEVKDALREKLQANIRYIESPQEGLGAAQLTHHKIHEIYVIQQGEVTLIAKTMAAQDIDAWGKRDFGKPYRDPKKGMLPPKLARMMVNLAVQDGDPEKMTIFDPFCGSGTVLMEALLMGCAVIGSDIDKDAVHGTGANLAWFSKAFDTVPADALSVQDATNITLADIKKQVDCIVTEPFLGRPNPTLAQLPNVMKGLEKMYLGVFKSFRSLLKPGGRISIVIPAFAVGGSVKTLDSLIDRLETLGYTREKGPFTYTRPQTTVQRQIFVYRVKG